MAHLPPILKGEDGRPIVLGPVLAEGGEARLVALRDDPTTLAKVFHRPTPGREERLTSLLHNPARDPSLLPGHRAFIWPESRLFDAAGPVAGILLPMLADARTLSMAIAPRLRAQAWPWADWRHILSLGATLAGLVAHLHRQGFIIGDLKPDNILLDGAMRPSLIDCDSFLPPGWTGPDPGVASEGYAAPENWRDHADGHRRDQAGDRYALAIVLGELLLGRRPGPFWDKGYPPSAVLGLDITDLMARALGPDNRQRPLAEEWRAALCTLLAGLRPCASHTGHYHPEDMGCPWCAVEASTGVTLFTQQETKRDPWTGLRLSYERALMLGDADLAAEINAAAYPGWLASQFPQESQQS